MHIYIYICCCCCVCLGAVSGRKDRRTRSSIVIRRSTVVREASANPPSLLRPSAAKQTGPSNTGDGESLLSLSLIGLGLSGRVVVASGSPPCASTESCRPVQLACWLRLLSVVEGRGKLSVEAVAVPFSSPATAGTKKGRLAKKSKRFILWQDGVRRASPARRTRQGRGRHAS